MGFTKAEVTQLRATLARLYRDRADAERLASDAGLDLARLILDGTPENRWFNLLEEAVKQRRSEVFFALAWVEYRQDEGLNALLPRARSHPEAAQIVASAGRADEPRDGGGTSVAGRFRAAVVAVAQELGDFQRRIAERVRDLPGISGVDLVDAGQAGAAVPRGDEGPVVVLLGARTGGTDVLAGAVRLDPRPSVLRFKAADFTNRDFRSELVPALDLHDLAKGAPEFDTPDGAADAARRAIAAWLADRLPPRPGGGAVPTPWEECYLRQARVGWREGSLGPLGSLGRKLHRADLYVSLRAEGDPAAPGGGAGASPKARKGRGAEMGLEAPEQREKPWLEALLSRPDLPHLVVEGEPGAGKTVLLQHAAHALAAIHLQDGAPEHRLDLKALGVGAPLSPRLPVLLTASALATCLARRDGVPGVVEAIRAEIKRFVSPPPDEAEVHAGLTQSRYLLLVDALDEIGTEAGRRLVLGGLKCLAAAHPKARFVLSTRPSAWLGEVDFRGLPVARAASLDRDDQGRIVARWSAARGWDEEARGRMVRCIDQTSARLDQPVLRDNPLLLTCTMTVYAEQGRLPESVAQLYHQVVDVLCKLRSPSEGGDGPPAPGAPAPVPSPFPTWNSRREALAVVFEAMQVRGTAAGGKSRTALAVEDAAWALRKARPQDFPDLEAGKSGLDRLYDETGLLRFDEVPVEGVKERSLKVVRPWHASFSDYLVAWQRVVRAESVVAGTDALLRGEGGLAAPFDDPAWRGVIRFLAGVHGERHRDDARAFAERLHAHARGDGVPRHPRAGRVYAVLAEALADERTHGLRGHPLLDSLPEELARSYREEGEGWGLDDRLRALDALGRLGDPRLVGPPWVAVPGGVFTMGGDGKAYGAAPAHRVRVGDLRVSWRPVTVADFEPFVSTGAFADGEAPWWKDGAGRVARGEYDGCEPDGWADQLFHPNRPVTGVSWCAARAFCRWATVHLGEAWGVPAGQAVDLPTEAEWEYLARGREGRTYPWPGTADPVQGDAAPASFGGYKGEGPGHPTPVGAYPLGNRRWGEDDLVDLAGNVWEWCLDAWRKAEDASWPAIRGGGRIDTVDNPCHLADSGSPRVVRGGPWVDDPRSLRCACRLRFAPRYRSADLGFRVVVRVPPEHEA